MSDRSHSVPPKVGWIPRGWTMPSALSPDPFQAGYQQALADFAITDLLAVLQPDVAAPVALTRQDIEMLAVVLIQALIRHLEGDRGWEDWTALLGHPLDLAPVLAGLPLPPLDTDLPETFPEGVPPRFAAGDRLRWRSPQDDAVPDWGG